MATVTDSKSITSKKQSRHPEQVVKIVDDAGGLKVMREEQISTASSERILPSHLPNKSCTSEKNQKCMTIVQDTLPENCYCIQKPTSQQNDSTVPIDANNIENLSKEIDLKLRAEYNIILMKEIESLRERFDYMLQNEQIRASYMLREAHRERQEKIRALESQLECKNLAGLMYVMCTERSRSKLEKKKLVEEYTNYIKGLQELLIEGQHLILSLSRGYKTAARVDNEWRTKMRKVVKEFMNFIYHFAGGPPETNQYFIDLPKLLETKAPIEDDPKEDPCYDEVGEEESVEEYHEKTWWERLEGDDRPFVVFGDMCDFTPPHRRQVLKTVKAAKTAPKVWKEYLFNDMSLKRSCENADEIKDVYPARQLSLTKNYEYSEIPDARNGYSRMSLASRRHTAVSVDIRGGDILAMGSILKIITSANTANQNNSKTTLLAAKDSMELTSTTKMRHLRNIRSDKPAKKEHFKEVFKLDIAKRHATNFNQLVEKETEAAKTRTPFNAALQKKLEPDTEESMQAGLGSLHTDSLQLMAAHKPDIDHKINYERVCPMEKCQRLQVDSFMRTLPPYMRANPYTHFQQTFEAYETCTPEQLEILKQRLEAKKSKDSENDLYEEDSPLEEWCGGIATQTSVESIDLPCTCGQLSTTPVDSNYVFNVKDLIPMKLAIDAIQKECLHDERIIFDRFKVVGKESEIQTQENINLDFKQHRSAEITKILKQHPSLLDIFQANVQ